MFSAKGDPRQQGLSATVGMPTTVLALAGTSEVAEVSEKTMRMPINQ
jgi:hypothetical protein